MFIKISFRFSVPVRQLDQFQKRLEVIFVVALEVSFVILYKLLDAVFIAAAYKINVIKFPGFLDVCNAE